MLLLCGIIGNVGIRLPREATPYPRKMKSSATLSKNIIIHLDKSSVHEMNNVTAYILCDKGIRLCKMYSVILFSRNSLRF